MKKNLWFKEWFTENESHSHRLKKHVVVKQTKFQRAIIADSFSFGRCLILDGEMQSAELDEFIYHEAIVHPAVVTHPEPKKILVLGAGEGATLREVLKYNSVKKVIVVDVDKEVVEFCKKYLYKWHKGSFKDNRAEIIIKDGREYVENAKEKFDIIISDLPSPIEKGPAYLLYTIEFYTKLKNILNRSGIFVLQAGSGNLLQIQLHKMLYATVKKVFRIVLPYYAFVPSFDVPWAFIFCSDHITPTKFSQKEIETLIKKKLSGAKLKFYDGVTHQGLFHIPLYLRNLLQEEKRIITDKEPEFFFK